MVRKKLPESLQVALDAIEDLKANQVIVLDLRGLNDATDYFVFHPETRAFYQLERLWSDAQELLAGST
jgi:ribosomal silencing factor RsfS